MSAVTTGLRKRATGIVRAVTSKPRLAVPALLATAGLVLVVRLRGRSK